jgi:hypothetical protein
VSGVYVRRDDEIREVVCCCGWWAFVGLTPAEAGPAANVEDEARGLVREVEELQAPLGHGRLDVNHASVAGVLARLAATGEGRGEAQNGEGGPREFEE